MLPAPLGQNPFEGSFDFGACYDPADPSNLPRDWELQSHGTVDVQGELCVSLDIEFNDDSSPTQNGTIKSIGWSAPRVHTKDDIRNATDKDYERVVLQHTKYILIEHYRSGKSEFRMYGRNNNVWRVRDIMTALLDMERYVRPQSLWFGGVDEHHIYLDYVSCKNSVVTYHFRLVARVHACPLKSIA